MQRETLDFDLLIVGGGPAGLAAAIRAKQCAGATASVALIDKGAALGAHILSGAIMDPIALDELLPDWRQRGAPLNCPVREERFLFLSHQGRWQVPQSLLPAVLHNRHAYVGSLGLLCQWLGEQAQALGVEIFTGFAGQALLYDEAGAVAGVITGDQGRLADGSAGPQFQPGVALRARYTLFGEGCRGHLGRALETRYGLRQGIDPQVYSLGLKELWRVPKAQHQPGLVIHTAGWPLPHATHGGGFMYHYGEGLVAVGLVVGLGYHNPWLSPFEELQRLKTHPVYSAHLRGGQCLAYGARTLVSGGQQSLPRQAFPGGALIGDDAGFLDPARLKGIHTAIKSGALAAEAACQAIAEGRRQDELAHYPTQVARSWIAAQLSRSRNFKPALRLGLLPGSLYFALEQHLLRGKAPWTLHHTPDHSQLIPAQDCAALHYPSADGSLTFSRLSALHLSNVHHSTGQPCHLHLAQPERAITLNYARYAAPETRYCPAGVYEIEQTPSQTPRLRINAENCLHCKACDIKDPSQNITWTPPQGGEGPFYSQM